MRRAELFLVVVSLLTACQFHVIRHDEDKAATEAAAVLKLIYVDGDYQAAHRRLHPELQPRVTPVQLAELAGSLAARQGVVTELQLDSFLPMPGQRAVTIFFNAVNERGQSFHRVTMMGDAAGYTPGGIFVQSVPYPEEKLRQRFSRPLVIPRQRAA